MTDAALGCCMWCGKPVRGAPKRYFGLSHKACRARIRREDAEAEARLSPEARAAKARVLKRFRHLNKIL